ncbi:MAG: replicative DNA helicase [Alphaproteobacteria bacterium]|nr:replicative DNA helicase [Alphaproteobacteria bacterium]
MDPFESSYNQKQLRELPHNIEAEQSLLGAIMLNNECFEDVSDIISSPCFYVPVNGQIFTAIESLIAADQTADPITLRAYFEKNNELQRIEGGNYLVQLVNSVVSLSGVTDYARLVHDLYIRRQLILIGENVAYNATKFDLGVSGIDQIENAEAKLYELAMSDTRGNCLSFSEIATEAVKTIELAFRSSNKLVGITSGFIDVNKKLGGLNRSDLIILAGRPSMGKTALATNIAFKVALENLLGREGSGKVAFFSLEMSAEQLVTRILSQECMIASERIRKGEIKDDDFARLVSTAKKLQSIPLYIEDTPAMTVAALRTRARKLKRQKGLDLIIIDYLQLLMGSSDKRNDNRVQEISEITRSLKSLAKELDIPVIALSQLSRAVEVRDDKRPQLADLRESGSIEQDADVVMFVYREEYYLERMKPAEDSTELQKWQNKMQSAHNKAEVIIAKQRHGPIGTVELFFDGQYTKFDNLAEDRQGK